MDIHKYEKAWIMVSIALVVVFIATVVYGSVAVGVKMVDDEGGTINPDEIPSDDRFGDPRVEEVNGEIRAYVVARQFIFQPTPIEIPANRRVTFYITSADVLHGFQVVNTNVNTMVIPGQIAELTVKFDEPGSYGVLCNEYCGAGHHHMEGELVVVPEDEWEGGE